MFLEDVKDHVLKDARRHQSDISYGYFMNHPALINKFERYLAYLHFLIMFTTPKNVHHLLKEHQSIYGDYATQMLINFPYICGIDKNVITPLMCAALWSNDPEMARVLCYWGADVSVTDINGKYPEEKYASYYVNHLNHLIAPNCFIMGLRTSKDFIEIYRELAFLTGSARDIPIGWRHPGSVYRQRSSLSTNVLSSSPPQASSAIWNSSGSEGTYVVRSLTETIPEETGSHEANEHA